LSTALLDVCDERRTLALLEAARLENRRLDERYGSKRLARFVSRMGYEVADAETAPGIRASGRGCTDRCFPDGGRPGFCHQLPGRPSPCSLVASPYCFSGLGYMWALQPSSPNGVITEFAPPR
jgi:hypothetical protein